MSDQNLIIEQSGPIARVTINRPKVLNALMQMKFRNKKKKLTTY